MALLLTVFVIAVGTMLVFELGRMSRYDQRSARAFAERVQGQYIVRSGFSVGQVLLSLPKEQQEDWLGDPWNLIGQAKQLPIEGLPGEPRIQIVDETAKFNLNWLDGKNQNSERWRERYSILFNQLGFEQEQFGVNERRTLGGTALDALTQVAAITDWIDEDSSSYQGQTFSGKGFESGAPKGFFFNREFKTTNELLLVPGMTRERMARLLPYVRTEEATGDVQKVNVNTARYETLIALGYPETTVSEIILGQRQAPIDGERLKELNRIDETLNAVTTTRSKEFSVIVRVRLPNSVRWGRAYISAGGAGRSGQRAASMRGLEIY